MITTLVRAEHRLAVRDAERYGPLRAELAARTRARRRHWWRRSAPSRQGQPAGSPGARPAAATPDGRASIGPRLDPRRDLGFRP